MAAFAWTNVVIFIVFALLQLNDPDPWGWTVIYLCAAGLWAAAAKNRVVLWGCVGLAIIVSMWMFTLLPGFADWIRTGSMSQLFGSLSMDKPYIEESREFLGLGLILFSAAYLGISRRLRQTR